MRPARSWQQEKYLGYSKPISGNVSPTNNLSALKLVDKKSDHEEVSKENEKKLPEILQNINNRIKFKKKLKKGKKGKDKKQFSIMPFHY